MKEIATHWVLVCLIFLPSAMRSSEMSVVFEQTTLSFISEDKTLRNYYCENIKSYKPGFNQKHIPKMFMFLFSALFTKNLSCSQGTQ
jgi:hypothetical protein